MIAYPIGYPIGFGSGRPNRPRIAHIESCRIDPLERHLCIPNSPNDRPRRPYPTTVDPEGMQVSR